MANLLHIALSLSRLFVIQNMSSIFLVAFSVCFRIAARSDFLLCPFAVRFPVISSLQLALIFFFFFARIKSKVGRFALLLVMAIAANEICHYINEIDQSQAKLSFLGARAGEMPRENDANRSEFVVRTANALPWQIMT